MSRNEPTISSLLRELADHFDQVTSEREVYEQVLARRPSRAKDPYASIREQLRFGAPRVGWVWLGGGKLIPLRVALQGLRFRLIPTGDEFAGNMIARNNLRPFVPYSEHEVYLQDAQGHPLFAHDTSLPLGEGIFGPIAILALDIGNWYQREQFELGDSIIITITHVGPLTLRLEREPAAAFRVAAVIEHEQELLNALVARVSRGTRNMIASEDSVLPIFAQASWRTGYPMRPWQQLVATDRRLRLLDDEYVADGSFKRPLDWIFGDDRDEQYWQTNDKAMLEEIVVFQAELRASRREAVERGVWNGIAPRISTARTIFDMHEGTAETIYPGAVDVLSDHSADIEEHIARGDYQDEGWADDPDMDDLIDFDIDDDFDLDDDLMNVDDIEDVRTFFEQNPELAAATKQLMESLSPQEIEQIQQAETFEDMQRIFSGRLSELLRTNPALFVPLEPPLLSDHSTNGNGNGHANGNGHKPYAHSPSLEDEDWEEDELFDDETWEDDEEEEEDRSNVDAALERSNELMEHFYQHQVEQGKSETTAMNRTRDLWIYADFLANYYTRVLDEGDYATLDECLFFHYPRKVINSSPRSAREICTSIKQFYAFLKGQGQISDDVFAVAIWKRRDQAARVVELYDQLDGDSPQFERLFAHLFAPYTA